MKTLIKTICAILACATFFTACANITNDPVPANTVNDNNSAISVDSKTTGQTTDNTVPSTSVTDVPKDPDVPFYQTELYKKYIDADKETYFSSDYCWYGFEQWIKMFAVGANYANLWLCSCEEFAKGEQKTYYNVIEGDIKDNPGDTVYGLHCHMEILVDDDETISPDQEEYAPYSCRFDKYSRYLSVSELEVEIENMKKHGFIILKAEAPVFRYVDEIDGIPFNSYVFEKEDVIYVAGTLDTIKSYVPTSEKVIIGFEEYSSLEYMKSFAEELANRPNTQ